MSKFPHYKQADSKDYDSTCLKIISKYHKNTIAIQELRKLSENTREGSSLLGVSNATERIGFRSLGAKVTLKRILETPFYLAFYIGIKTIMLYCINLLKGKR